MSFSPLKKPAGLERRVGRLWQILGVGVISYGLLAGCDAEPPFSPLSYEEIQVEPTYTSLRATELQEKHRVTPHATNRELAGKVIEVEGLAAVVGKQPTGQWFITLHGGAKGKLPIQCFVDDEEPWKRVAPGIALTVKGQLARTPPREVPRLLHATIVSVDEKLTPPRRKSAAELCESYSKDHLLAQDEFLDKWVWVTGEIASVDRVNGVIYLHGQGRMQVHCVPLKDEESLKLPLEPGTRITLLGKVVGGDRLRVTVRECLPPEILSDRPESNEIGQSGDSAGTHE